MANAMQTRHVAECFWAGVQQEDLRQLERRIEASVEAVAGDDEVVLVLFEGAGGTVRRVAEHAEIPFGRILQVAYAPWPRNRAADEEAMT
jgi:hypothetical protein